MNEKIQRSLAPPIIRPGIRYRSYYDRGSQTYRDSPTFGETFQAQFAYSYDGINWDWQTSSSPIGTKMTDFDYNHSNSRFIAVGEGANTMAYCI